MATDSATKMHHGFASPLAEAGEGRGLVADIGDDQRSPSNRPSVTTGKIVEGNRQVAGFMQREADMAADIAGAAGDQDSGSTGRAQG